MLETWRYRPSGEFKRYRTVTIWARLEFTLVVTLVRGLVIVFSLKVIVLMKGLGGAKTVFVTIGRVYNRNSK